MPKLARPSNPLALAVLALLFERPMHPYEMGVTMKERHKHESIKLRYGSLYTVIEMLLGRRLIAPKQTLRDGKRPERTVYAITPAGLAVLRDWMRDLIGKPQKDYPQFEAGLCLMPVLPPDEATALLRERLVLLEKDVKHHETQLAGIDRNFPPLFVVEGEFRLALLKAEQRFVKELVRRIAEDGWGPLDLWRGFHENRAATMKKIEALVAGTAQRERENRKS